MTDLDGRCPYDDPQLRKAYRRGLKAAEAGDGIGDTDHGYVSEERLLAFIEGFMAVKSAF
jgi:hypothetical protein